MRVTRDYNLAKVYPDLAKEWHPTKNGKLTPFEVSPYSEKKRWWLCEQNHEWEAIVGNRSKGQGCPHCYGRYATKENNLAIKYPEIAKEWHPTKNGTRTPHDVTPKSSFKAWWICKQGHSWQATVSNRAEGRGCRRCRPRTSKLELRIFCEFKTLFDDVRWREKIDGIECDIYLPQHRIGIEIDGYPWHQGLEKREKRKQNAFNDKGITLLHVRDSKLKPITLTDVFYSSREKDISILRNILKRIVANICSPKDKEKVAEYLQSNQLANVEEYRRMLSLLPSPPFEKSFAHLFPKLAEEWDFEKNRPLNPSMFSARSGIKVSWKCPRGHGYKATIDRRVAGRGCPLCAGKIVTEDNNLGVKYPELATQWHPTKNEKLTPYKVSIKSNRKINWICSKGHEWEAVVSSRTSGSGCPYCSGRRATKEYNFAVKHPELVREWHPVKNGSLTPYDVTPYCHIKAWWKCPKGHDYEASVAHRSAGRGCPTCYKERRKGIRS